MKSQRVMPKWLAMAFALAVFLAFAFVLPSASAQDENPLTPTPFEPSLNPDATPTMEATPEPPPTLEIPQEDETQLLPQMQATAPLSGTWSTQVNISNTVEESVKPKIATDKNGIEHVVWREVVNGGKQDILYTRYDGTSWSSPVNVSHSSSFNSDSPKLVTDSSGTAHIVWQEEDNDHADDYETLYSRCNETGCTSPVTLSDGQVCGYYVYDWKAIDPTIGIDANDRLMAAWMSYEPGRIYIMYSLWPASSLPPANRTGCHVNSGTYAYPMVAGDSNGNFHLAMMSYSYGIYYSKFVNGWSYVQNIGSGYDPVIYIDQNNKIHAAWWSNNAPPVYRTREGSASVWSTPENVFSSMLCSDISLITDEDNLPRLSCAANGFVYETSRQADPEGWTDATIIAGNDGIAGQPNLAKDGNGDLHLVWSDFRDENWEIYYSAESNYDCSGTTLSHIGQAVFDVVGEQNYCLNSYEGLTFITSPSSADAAFREFGNLASQANYEVDFTTMIWDQIAGRRFLEGVKELYGKVQANSSEYPDGMRVRILLGAEYYLLPRDQRATVVNTLVEDLGIPLVNSVIDWKVEVASYRNSKVYFDLFSLSPNIHSHTKMLIVDGNKAIVSGYNLQSIYLFTSMTDTGIHISGPIVQDSLMAFDELWYNARGTTQLDPILHVPEVLAIRPVTTDPVNIFSLFRNDEIKTADAAITKAIESASVNLNLLQDRFFENTHPVRVCYYRDTCIDEYLPESYPSGEKGNFPYTDSIKVAAANGVRVQMLLSGSEKSMNSPSIENLRNQVLSLQNGSDIYSNITVRFSKNPLHAKALSIDEQFLIVGSQNFDYSAFGDQNQMDLAEYSFGVDSNRAAGEFNTNFTSLWNDAQIFTIVDNSIQETIDRALPGTIIYIPAGVYREDLTINKPLTLIGRSTSSTILENSGPILITSSGVTIRNLSIRNGVTYGMTLRDTSPSSLKEIAISNIVFENNVLGGVLIEGLISGSPIQYTIENNTFISGQAGITLNLLEVQPKASLIRNNIFIGQSSTPLRILSTSDGHVEYSYNLFSLCEPNNDCAANWYIGSLATASIAHDNLFDLDPQFMDPAFGDYRLAPTSPLIDAGDPNTVYELILDGDGDGVLQIDIGAFESFLVLEQLPPLADDIPDRPGLLSETSANNSNLRYFLAPSEDEDWFRFHMEENGNLQIHLTSLPANYDLYVYNAAGQLLGSSTKDKKAAEMVKLTNAMSGDYYVRIVGVNGAWSATNPYQLRFSVPGTSVP